MYGSICRSDIVTSAIRASLLSNSTRRNSPATRTGTGMGKAASPVLLHASFTSEPSAVASRTGSGPRRTYASKNQPRSSPASALAIARKSSVLRKRASIGGFSVSGSVVS